MGRVTNETPAATAVAPPSSPLLHFTHPHELHPTPLYNPQTLCSGCKLQSNGTMFTCKPCNFTLHQSCAKLPQFITHPSHGGCTLTLLPTASYPGGIFNCDACSRRGDGWSYHCTRCEYDLHVTCASKPLKIRHQSHTSCELDLTFKNPYTNSSGFSCDICRKIGSKQWLYRCNVCEFDVHLDCTAPRQPVLQQYHSLPASLHQNPYSGQVNGGLVVAPSLQQPHLMHSVSAGGVVNPNYGVNHHQFQQGPVQMNAGQVYGSMVPVNQAPRAGDLGSNLMMSAVQGLVEGAFQGIGQTVVQEVFGGGDGGGGGDDGGGESV